MARSRRKAFTLIELLVVIVILGLLMALLVPTLRGVWQRYYMTRCQTNLAHIYQAFRLRAADEARGVEPAYQVAAWKAKLQPYLENDDSQFFCMETVEGTAPRPITDFVEFRTKAYYYPPNLYTRHDPPLVLTTQMEPGPYMLKLSDTQYWAIRAMGPDYLWNNGVDDIRSKADCDFQPDGNPYRYWLCMEDYGGDWDYKDVQTRVTDNRDGTVKLEFFTGVTGNPSYLMNKLTALKIFAIETGKTHILDVEILIESSYGMNEYAIDKVTDGKLVRGGVGGAGGKILVLDYSCLVALPDVDKWATDLVFKSAQSGVPNFARHFGMANILFSDGSVHPERPEDIDPYIETFKMKWWEP